MALEGFPGCVGFVDGTGIPLYQKPGFDGSTFYDRKGQYSINAQVICNCNKKITAIFSGWPGSCADSRVYKMMSLANEPEKWFSKGQYLLADSAYSLTPTIIPSYKGKKARNLTNIEFNYCVAKSHVRNEHTIGILKHR